MKNRILIVDDSETNNILLENILAEAGYNTIVAYNAGEAFQRIKTEVPALILLDIMMPQTDGLQMLDMLRSEEATSKIPVLMVTARDDEESKELALKIGAQDYIKKPVDIYSLIEKVNSILKK